MRVLPASPRKRRRLLKIGVVVLAVLVFAVLTAIFKRPSNDRPSSAPAQGYTYVEDRPVKLTPEMRTEILKGIPLNRLGDAIDVARIYLFLASDLSAYVSGAQVVVDGGYLLG